MNSKFETNYFVVVKGFLKNSFLIFYSFLRRVKKSFLLLSGPEKYLAIGLLIFTLILSGIKAHRSYIASTVPAPTTGGTYKEAVVGQLNFLNPIMASSDVDKSVSGLIFSSLVKFDKNKNMIFDIAKNVETSSDNLQYTFTLRDNVYFHDGTKLTADDVAYTVNSIKDPIMQSPLNSQWKDVTITTTAPDKVIFTLPKAYGPFIYNCDFGILPSYLSSDDFAKKIIGSGPYEYDSAEKNGLVFESIKLKRNKQYFGQNYYINNIELNFFTNKDEAKLTYDGGGFSALSGATSTRANTTNLSYETSKRLVLVPNLRKDKFKDINFRKTLLNGQKFPQTQKLTLSTLDADAQRAQAESLKSQFKKQNIDLTVNYYNATDFQKVLDEKKYELLLFGYDLGQDLDPYIFWDSSQLNYKNYAGYSDKTSDLLLEEARMTADPAARNAKYEQFYQILNDQALAKFFPFIKSDFMVDNSKVKGINAVIGNDPVMKYYNMSKWYIEEKRVKKTKSKN